MSSGCAVTNTKTSTKEEGSGVSAAPISGSLSNAAENITVPAGGFSWNEMACIAASRSSSAQLAALQIKRSHLQNRIDRAWRDPQLRLNSSFASEDEYEYEGDNRHEDINSYGAGLRFYISNPFVNRWIKEQAAESAESITAQREELSYAVYCETRMKCCEVAVNEDKLNQLKVALEQQKNICARYADLKQSGYAAPLKMIKAELKSAKTEQQIIFMERQYRNSLFQLALLTGLDIDKIKLESIDKQSIQEPSAFNVDDMTELAVDQRPDLRSIRCDIALARSGLRIAEARQVPWFDFVEGGYRNRNADSTTYSGTSPNHSDSDRDEWIVRTAISLPIFSWAGHETTLARTLLKEVELTESFALIAVRNEIRNALDNYTDAFSSRKKMEADVKERMQEFRKTVEELDSSKTVVETEILDTEEQLNAFSRGTRRSLYDCLKLKLYLESVTGLKTEQ